MQRSLWLPAALAAVLLTLAPASASADVYSVFSCRDPLGPVNEAVGWVGTKSGTGQVTNGCTAGGALTATLGLPRPEGDSSATWTFPAPPGTRIVRFHARRTTAGLAKSNQASDLAYILETDTATLEKCAPSTTESSCIADLTAPVQKEGLNGSVVRFRAICTNAGGFCSAPLRVDTTQVNIGLQDMNLPTVANVKLLDDGDQSGKLTVGFDAADVGGGLYRTVLKVDGKPVRAGATGGPPCVDALPADADPYQFDVPIPCPRVLSGATAGVDVRALTPGAHGVEIVIEDAAGNEATVLGSTEFPRRNGTNASVKATLKMWFARGQRRLGTGHTSRYGTRVVTRGILRNENGRGIQGARIDVYHIRKGKKRLLKTGLKTRAGGKLTLILPNDVDTRHVQYAYRAVRPGKITSSQTLRLNVRSRGGKLFYRR
ncbi:MAG TPA: hypothetical protein VGO80_11565 [Solirubrobacteraceae bacterium]|nr:hypothetical protein [Solirubrobacteraceae bacterium]